MSMSCLQVRPRFDQQRLLNSVIAVLGCGISLVLTIEFCREVRGHTQAWVPIAIGTVWELAKYNFAVTSLVLLAEGTKVRKLAGVLLGCLALVLVAGSIVASVGYMTALDGEVRGQRVTASERYTDLKASIRQIDTQVEAYQQAAKADMAGNYRTRGLQTLKNVTGLLNERARMADELRELETRGSEKGNSIKILGNALSPKGFHSNARLHAWAFALISIVLELISVAALALLRLSPSGLHVSEPTYQTAPQEAVSKKAIKPAAARSPIADNPPAIRKAGMATAEAKPTTDIHQAPIAKYDEAKELILSGRIPPNFRAVRSSLRVGQEPARAVMEALQREGVIIKTGRRFQIQTSAASSL